MDRPFHPMDERQTGQQLTMKNILRAIYEILAVYGFFLALVYFGLTVKNGFIIICILTFCAKIIFDAILAEPDQPKSKQFSFLLLEICQSEVEQTKKDRANTQK